MTAIVSAVFLQIKHIYAAGLRRLEGFFILNGQTVRIQIRNDPIRGLKIVYDDLPSIFGNQLDSIFSVLFPVCPQVAYKPYTPSSGILK